jgi:hypothetical protein
VSAQKKAALRNAMAHGVGDGIQFAEREWAGQEKKHYDGQHSQASDNPISKTKNRGTGQGLWLITHNLDPDDSILDS